MSTTWRTRYGGARDSQEIDTRDMGQDITLQEEISELSASEKPSRVVRAKSEAEEAIRDATLADIRGMTLMERGRCPRCGGRTESLLFSAACTSCGWFRRFAPEGGHCAVLLDTGETIECDRVLEVESDQVLCVKDNVVRSQLARQCVRRIDYEWADEDLATATERYIKEHAGICAWCETLLKDLDEEGAPFEEFVAFGAFQERYLLCSSKCLRAFRKQYPTRIHRNCYETDCGGCKMCIRRYDVEGYHRTRL